MDLAVDVYGLIHRLPKVKSYRLGDQLARAAASVAANIAEGNARGTRRDYANFLSIAKGSLVELETFLLLAVRLKFVSAEDTAAVFGAINEIERMLSVLRRRLLAPPT